MSTEPSSESNEKRTGRRELIKDSAERYSSYSSGFLFTVASMDTDSGEVELNTDATVPDGTTIEIRVYEDLDGSGIPDNSQEAEILDGDRITQYDDLEGGTGDDGEYWLDIKMETDDQTTSPELHSATLSVPTGQLEETDGSNTQPASEQQNIGQLWENFLVFVSGVVGGYAILGIMSKSMAVASYAAFLAFAYIASETGHGLLTNILRVALVVILVGYAFKLWRLEGTGG